MRKKAPCSILLLFEDSIKNQTLITRTRAYIVLLNAGIHKSFFEMRSNTQKSHNEVIQSIHETRANLHIDFFFEKISKINLIYRVPRCTLKRTHLI